MPEFSEQLGSIARHPPGATDIGHLKPQGRPGEVIWFLRDTTARIRALPSHSLQFRFLLFVEDDVLVIACLFCVGTLKPGNLWEAWFNARLPGREVWLRDLSRQAHSIVSFIGDGGTEERVWRDSNRLADFATAAMTRLRGLPSWSAAEFERARERIYERYPDLLALWNSAERSPQRVPAGSEMPGAAAAIRPDLDSFDGLLSSAEATLRGMYGHVQSLLNCFAPLAGAVSFRGLADYANQLRCQAALNFMPLHLWDMAVKQARQRGLLRPHPADPEYLAIPDEFLAVLRGRLAGYGSPQVRQALEWAFHATYFRIAADLRARYTSGTADEREAAVAATRVEYENLAAALDYGLRGRLPVLDIYKTLGTYLNESRHFQRGIELAEKVLARLDRSADDGAARLGLLRDIAACQQRLRQFDKAYATCRKALELSLLEKTAGTPAGAACVAGFYQTLGQLAGEQHRWKRAAQNFQQAMQIGLATGNRAAQAQSHRHLAQVAFRQGDTKAAKEHTFKALEIFTALGDRHAQAGLCLHFSRWAAERGKWSTAKKYCRSARTFFIEFGDQGGIGQATLSLGTLARFQGKNEAARRHCRKAINTFFAIGDLRGRAMAYNELGITLAAVGDVDSARKIQMRAMKLNRMLNDRFAQGMTYAHLAKLAVNCQDWQRARLRYEKAIELCNESDDTFHVGMFNLDAGRLAYDQGQNERGREHLRRGLRCMFDWPDRRARRRALVSVAEAWQASGDNELPEVVAEVFFVSREEAEDRLRKALGQS